jgi:uncharacterized membrane protein YhaH (DUF805 family)
MILPFKRYADFEGRSRRMEFWMFQLLNIVLVAVLAMPFIFSLLGTSLAAADGPDAEQAIADALVSGGFGLSTIGIILYGIYALVALIPSIAVTVRRLHDRDMSGWWYLGLTLVGFIPLVGFLASIALLVLMVLPGTEGGNRFGPDPKNPHSEDVFA